MMQPHIASWEIAAPTGHIIVPFLAFVIITEDIEFFIENICARFRNAASRVTYAPKSQRLYLCAATTNTKELALDIVINFEC